jgi:heme/copper-type cytochrome/quinol oxidase subunit 4
MCREAFEEHTCLLLHCEYALVLSILQLGVHFTYDVHMDSKIDTEALVMLVCC